ncbi:hypothetical protein [Streptomyces sp. NPDC087856]|uniref:hypothetical protein n=1 Tax=Streptomyces sp. NPDC087856 TaxID=3365811 RepID=UPI00382A8021
MFGQSRERAAQWHAAAAEPYGAWTCPGGALRLDRCLHRVPADLPHGQVERPAVSRADAHALARSPDGVDDPYREPRRIPPLAMPWRTEGRS